MKSEKLKTTQSDLNKLWSKIYKRIEKTTELERNALSRVLSQIEKAELILIEMDK